MKTSPCKILPVMEEYGQLRASEGLFMPFQSQNKCKYVLLASPGTLGHITERRGPYVYCKNSTKFNEIIRSRDNRVNQTNMRLLLLISVSGPAI